MYVGVGQVRDCIAASQHQSGSALRLNRSLVDRTNTIAVSMCVKSVIEKRFVIAAASIEQGLVNVLASWGWIMGASFSKPEAVQFGPKNTHPFYYRASPFDGFIHGPGRH